MPDTDSVHDPANPYGEDLDLVDGETTIGALARLQDAGMGHLEANEFLVEAVAARLLTLDDRKRLRRVR